MTICLYVFYGVYPDIIRDRWRNQRQKRAFEGGRESSDIPVFQEDKVRLRGC